MEDKRTLLARIITCDFVLAETALFLDTHPNCAEALSFYKKYLEMRKTANDEYTAKYGMLTASDYNGENNWQWIKGPWPWENEEV